MPILGRQGESLSQRLFGNPGVGQGLKNINKGGLSYLVDRTQQAMDTAGGFLGPKAEASTNYPTYTPSSNNYNVSSGAWQGPLQNTSMGDSSAIKAAKANSDKAAKDKAEADKKKQEDNLRKSIGSQFDDILGNYSSQIKDLPGQQQRLISGVEEMAGTQKNTIQSSLDNILAKLTGQREEVGTMQKQTLQDLADNTRNLFQAGNIYLGARGAGDSSATGMYSAALTQNANKQRAGVQRDVNSMYKDIGMKEADVQTDFQAQLNEVDTWKQSQTQNIVMKYTDLKRQLEQARANAQGMEKQNLANLEKELYMNAQQQLMNIQNAASQLATNLNSTITETGSPLGKAGADSIAQTGQYEVGQVYSPQQVNIDWGNVGSDQRGNMVDMATGNLWRVDEENQRLQYVGNNGQNGF
jgi:hypothetical protein